MGGEIANRDLSGGAVGADNERLGGGHGEVREAGITSRAGGATEPVVGGGEAIEPAGGAGETGDLEAGAGGGAEPGVQPAANVVARPVDGAAVTAEAGVQTPLKQHIIIVDDDPSILSAVRRSLSTKFSGITIDTADGVEAALSIVDSLREATNAQLLAVISDVMMPDQTGADLYHALRKILKKLPIVLHSGGGMPEEIEAVIEEIRGGKDPFARFIEKPALPAEYVAAINEMIALAGHEAATAAAGLTAEPAEAGEETVAPALEPGASDGRVISDAWPAKK
jgi:CheY-like chemotaxis protein